MSGDLFGNDWTLPANKDTDPLACAPAPKPKAFDGKTYDAKRDGQRLTSQLKAVEQILSGGGAWTLYDLAARVSQLTGKRASESGVSARIRDLRKERFGGYEIIDIKPTTEAPGVWRYQMKGAQ